MSLGMICVMLALGFTNAVLFPAWTGYSGGAHALPPGIENVLPYFVILTVNAGVLWLTQNRIPNRGMSVPSLFLITAFTRIAYVIARYAQGSPIADQDTALFFSYGEQLALGNYTWMEYPQGALLLFTAGYWLSAGNLEIFRVVLPLINLMFELMMLASLLWLGKRYSAERVATSLGLFYAISPFTLVLWYGKYDVVPAAFLFVGLISFLANRYSLSAFLLGIGFLVKWFPGIPLAFLVIQLILARSYRLAIQFTLIATATILIPLVIFWQISPNNVLYTYTFQGTRSPMGESLIYILLYFIEPAVRLANNFPPWEAVKSNLVSSQVSTIILIVSVGWVWILSALKYAQKESVTVLAGLGVAAFILANRVFSPQFILVLFGIYAIGVIIFSTRIRFAMYIDLVLLLVSFLNFLVWPLWYEHWFVASALFFLINLIFIGGLIYLSIRSGNPASSQTAPKTT